MAYTEPIRWLFRREDFEPLWKFTWAEFALLAGMIASTGVLYPSSLSLTGWTWTAFILLILMHFMFPVAVFAFVLSGGLLEGLAMARDPAHRATPLSPWAYFTGVLRPRFRVWLGMWLAYYSIWLILILLNAITFPELFLEGLMFVGTVSVSPLLYIISATIALAPRGSTFLAFRALIAGTAAFALSIAAPAVLSPASDMVFFIPPLFGLLALAGVAIRIRKQGVRWFRFEE